MKRKVRSSFSSAPCHNQINNPGNNGFTSQQGFLPHHLAAQNGHAGMPILGSQAQGQFRSPNTLQNMSQFASFPPYQQVMPPNLNQMMPQQLHGQCFLQNQPQNLNQIMVPGFPQNLNQMMGLPQGQLFLQNPMGNLNQIMSMQCSQLPIGRTQVVPFNIPPCSLLPWRGANQQAPQNPVFAANLQSGVGNSNMNQDASQHLQGNIGPGQVHGNPNNLQNAGYQQSQGNHVEENGNDMSKTKQESPSSKNFTRNHHMSGKRELSHVRFQKSQHHHSTNAKKTFGPTCKHGHAGKNSGRAQKHSLESRKAARECQRSQRSISLNYTEEEIQLWREARKKNFPKTTTDKKFTQGSKFNDPDAEMRRKQLKEILAKQAELGVEVAELPPNYLTDTENQTSGGKDDRMAQNRMGKFQNKFRKRNKHGRNKQHAKRRNLGYEPSRAPTANNREPTLLQKLLSRDIKRDKSHLLQVFRFMVLNSFFKEWPDKPLQFPRITVKTTGCENDTVSNIYSLNERGSTASGVGKNVLVEATGIEDHDNSVVDENNNEVDDGDSGGEDMTNQYGVTESGLPKNQTEKSGEEEGEMTQ